MPHFVSEFGYEDWTFFEHFLWIRYCIKSFTYMTLLKLQPKLGDPIIILQMKAK